MKKIRGNQIELAELFTEGVTVTGILDFVVEGSPAISTPQLVLPSYTTVGIPATSLDGGLVYDSTLKFVTFYNGTEWKGIIPSKNWISANFGNDFDTAPVDNGGIAIGDSASTTASGLAIGSSSSAGNTGTALGHGAGAAGAGGGASVAIGNTANANALGAICIGATSSAVANAITIGRATTANKSNDIVIGHGAHSAIGNSGGDNTIIGTGGLAFTDVSQSVIIGTSARADLDWQVVIGKSMNDLSVTTDVAHSVKIGSSDATNKNILHLYSKGKLELVGDEAQYVLPNYAVTGSPIDVPANSVEGGLVYDSTGKALAFYNGTSWEQVGGDVLTSYGTTGAISLDTNAGTYFYPTGTTTGIITFSFTNPASTGNVTAFTMELLGAGDNAPVWPASVDWPASTEPTWTVGGLDIVSFVTRDGGTTWYGMLGGLAFG